jgi:hypothetical protein
LRINHLATPSDFPAQFLKISEPRRQRLKWDSFPHPGLPDGVGIFRPKILMWANFGGSCIGRCWYMYLMRIRSLLRPSNIFDFLFGIFCGNFVYFPPFCYVVPRKIWHPCPYPVRLEEKHFRSSKRFAKMPVLGPVFK